MKRQRTIKFDIESGTNDVPPRISEATNYVQSERFGGNSTADANFCDNTAVAHGNDDFDNSNDDIEKSSLLSESELGEKSRDLSSAESIPLSGSDDDLIDLEANNVKDIEETENEKLSYRAFSNPLKKKRNSSSVSTQATASTSWSNSSSHYERQGKPLCTIRSLSLGKFSRKPADLKLFFGDESQINATANLTDEWRFISCRARRRAEMFDGIFGKWEDISHRLPSGRPVLLTLTARDLSRDIVNEIIENIHYLSGIVLCDIVLNCRYQAFHSDVLNSLKSILEAAKKEENMRSDFTTAVLEIIPSETNLRPELVLDIVKFASTENGFPFQIVHGERPLDVSEPGMGAFLLFAHPVVAPVLWGNDLPKPDINKTNAAIADAKSMIASMMDPMPSVESLDTEVGIEEFLLQTKNLAILEKQNHDERRPKAFIRIAQFLEECPRHEYSTSSKFVGNKEEKAQVAMNDLKGEVSLSKFYSQVWNPEQEPMPIHKTDNPWSYLSLGQKQIGTSFDPEGYEKMLTMMKKLRVNGLLLDLGKGILTEISQGSDEKNEDVILPAVRFSEAISDLERASKRTNHPVWRSIRREYQSNVVEDIFKITIDGLKNSKIKVWEVIRTHTISNDSYESCFQVDDDGMLHTYVNREIPNLAEAILYSCARAFSPLSHTSCVLLESLLLPDQSEYDDERWLLSRRIRKWLSIAPYAELGSLIVNGRRQFYGTGDDARQLPSSLSSLCAQQVSSVCQSRLLDEVDKLQDSRAKYSHLLSLACLQDCAWARLFDDAAWSKTSRDAFIFLLAIGMKPNPCVLKHAHQRALDDMYASIRGSNSYITRQPDLVTVYNELSGRNDHDTEQVFGLSKHDVSGIMYDRLRDDYFNEDPCPKDFLQKEGYYVRGSDRLLSKVLRRKKHLDGIFWMLPLLLSLLSFYLTGVAPLANVSMPLDETFAINTAIITSLPINGALNNVISTLSCPYLFSWNFELLADIQLRILCGLIFVFLPAYILFMAFLFFCFGKDFWFLFIFGIFTFLFSVMFFLIGALFNSHFNSIWKSPEGRAIIFGQILSFLAVSPLQFRHDLCPSNWLWTIHAIGLLSCDIFMIICLCYQHCHKMGFYRKLTVTPTEKLVEFDTSIDDFMENTENEAILTAKAKIEKRDKARKDFCNAVTAKRMPRKLSASLKELVLQRRIQFRDEELLFKWYSQMFSVDRPAVASEEWDTAIEDAKKAMTLKSKTNILHRGGLTNLLPRAVLGFVYFVILLVDIFILLAYSDGATVFSPTEEMNIIQGWAIIYTLLAYGALEILPLRITAGEMLSSGDGSIVDNTSALSELIRKNARKKKEIYKNDLRRMLLNTIPISIMVATAGLFWLLEGKLSVDVWIFFFAAVFSYTGLILASFNMLFLTNPVTIRFSLMLGSGIPLGVGLSITAIEMLGSPKFAIVALGVSTWTMYLITLRIFLRQVGCSDSILQDEVLTAFALHQAQSNSQFISGQKWIGREHSSDHLILESDHDRPARFVALNNANKAKEKNQTLSIVPGRGIGSIIEDILEQSFIWWFSPSATKRSSAARCLAGLEPGPSILIMEVLQSWRKGDIKVEQCNEQCLLSDSECFSALGKLNQDHTLEVFVGIGGSDASSVLATRIAEAMIHEYVEMVLHWPHHAAVISELLLHRGEMRIPFRVQRQIELMDRKALRRLTEDTAVTQLKISARDGNDFSRWSTIRKSDRYSIVRRLRGDFLPNEALLEGQFALSELVNDACSKRLCHDRSLPFRPNGDDAIVLNCSKEDISSHTVGLYPLMVGVRTLLSIMFLQLLGDPSVHHELYHAETANISDGGLPLLVCLALKVVGLRIHQFVFGLYNKLLWQLLLFLPRKDLRLLHNEIKQLQKATGADGGTKAARRRLWQAWNKGEIDGIFSIYWDERLLRDEPSMKPYWYFRDRGWYNEALESLESNYQIIEESSMINAQEKDVMTHLCFRMQDLRMMGTAGQSPKIKDRPPKQKFPSEEGDGYKIRVAGLDSGTWPTQNGGVASCRRDLVERLPRISWVMYPEVGNTFQKMNYKFETNVESMNFIWLWGCDLDGPNERMFSTTPAVALMGRKLRTTNRVLQRQWAPLLRDVVRLLARGLAQSPSTAELDSCSRLCLRVYDYFQEYDWNLTWASPITRMAWRQAWMLELEEQQSRDKFFRAERPTSKDLDTALAMIWHFLMPLSTPLEPLPVYHGSHHGPQLLLSVIAKLRFGSSVIIWDHGLVWRERIVSFSESHYLTLFVRNVLTEMVAFGSKVIYHNSDAIVSCNSQFNPDWEVYIGGGPNSGSMNCERTRKKLSPVVNGMAGDAFKPCRATEEPYPCAVMLSHVYPLKDVLNAIMAADQIINVWNIKSFKLIVYGSTTKDVEYVAKCKAYIASNDLGDHVYLMGAGPAPKVLPRGWVFLNSSASEGLPLALGEAGLSGLPVVCTDVGGSYEVVTDSGFTYGGIAPPRDPEKLARAILKVLSMTDELGDVGLSTFTGKPEELTRRIHESSKERRLLGMKYRCCVKTKFGIDRYLREHEQIIAWCALCHEERQNTDKSKANSKNASKLDHRRNPPWNGDASALYRLRTEV